MDGQDPVGATPGPVDVFVCRCGKLMADWVDPGALARRAGPDPRAARVCEQPYSCFGEGLTAIVDAARARPVLVAACSEEMHGATLARALAAAGLPDASARLIDVRGEGWECRAKPRGTAFAEALLADALDEVEPPDEAEARPVARVTVVGGGVAADEAAALLEAGGIEVDWLDEPVESPEPGARSPEPGAGSPEPGAPGPEPVAPQPDSGPPRVTAVRRENGSFVIERGAAAPLTAGAIVLAFEALDRPLDSVRPFVEPGPLVAELASAEAGFDETEPPAAPGVIALVTGCLPGAARSRAPGVGLARTAVVALALHERWPEARLALFHGDAGGAPAGTDALLASIRQLGGLIVRGAVHRAVWSEGQLHVHAVDADLGRRVRLPVDLLVVDPGQQDDPRAAEWCGLVGIPSTADLDPADVYTRVPGVLLASGPGPVGPAEAALRGAACAAHCLARLRSAPPRHR